MLLHRTVMPFLRINTTGSSDYGYYPVAKSRVTFHVKADHDAQIALRTHLGEDSNMYEIILGRWGNTVSAIKRNNMEPDVAEANTVDILKESEIREIWIQWACDGLLSVGREDEEPFLTYKDKDPFVINYIGFRTAWGATGEWMIEKGRCTSRAVRQQLVDTCHYWVDCNESTGFPRNAVVATEDGKFVGRAHHQESVTPGEVKDMVCSITWDGAVHRKKEFQVLCGKEIDWVKSSGGSLPLHALPAGETEDGYALFIGRVFYDGEYQIGKIQPNHQVCYIQMNGQESPCADYEVLVIYDRSAVECIGR